MSEKKKEISPEGKSFLLAVTAGLSDPDTLSRLSKEIDSMGTYLNGRGISPGIAIGMLPYYLSGIIEKCPAHLLPGAVEGLRSLLETSLETALMIRDARTSSLPFAPSSGTVQ